jgi:hypothetical protein
VGRNVAGRIAKAGQSLVGSSIAAPCSRREHAPGTDLGINQQMNAGGQEIGNLADDVPAEEIQQGAALR